MTKRALTMALILALLTSCLVNGQVQEIRVTVNHQPLALDVAPVIIDGRAMVPMRGIFEALGAEVTWHEDTKTITASSGSTIILLALDLRTSWVNGRAVTLDAAPSLIRGRTMVPLRFVAESLGATVDWDEASGGVSIVRPTPATDSIPVDTGSAHDVITKDVREIGGVNYVSRIERTQSTMEPVAWASPRATGGDRLGLQGTQPVVSWAGNNGRGRVAVFSAYDFFTSVADGQRDNDAFRVNLLTWLLGRGKRIGLTTAHSEWLYTRNLSPVLTSWAGSTGITLTNVPSTVTQEALQNVDLLVMGNPWGAISTNEMDAIGDWVSQGGSLLVLASGWSWYSAHDDPDGDSYPVNQMGQRFGWHVVDGTINDPDYPANYGFTPAFKVLPLNQYHPRPTVVLKAEEMDVNQVKSLAVQDPGKLYVIQGKTMGLQLPTDDWSKLDNPAAALNTLEKVYQTELTLMTNRNKPYDGEPIWLISKADPATWYYLHAGNPIVAKTEAMREFITSYNRDGYPGWGVMHELGHDMHMSAANNLYVPVGTEEEWANVFNIWAHIKMGWSDRIPPTVYDEGHAYHQQANPDYEQLKSSPWVLLGCLELIWQRYGWDGMQTFLSQAASDAAQGIRANDDTARTAYLIENLSRSYKVDFAPLFSHWGFSVSEMTRNLTATYPQSSIAW